MWTFCCDLTNFFLRRTILQTHRRQNLSRVKLGQNWQSKQNCAKLVNHFSGQLLGPAWPEFNFTLREFFGHCIGSRTKTGLVLEVSKNRGCVDDARKARNMAQIREFERDPLSCQNVRCFEFRWNIISAILRRRQNLPALKISMRTPQTRAKFVTTKFVLRFCPDNRPHSIYQYFNMAPRLSGQNCQFLKFLLSRNSQKRLGYKENNAKFGSLSWKPRSRVRIYIEGGLFQFCPIVRIGPYLNNQSVLFADVLRCCRWSGCGKNKTKREWSIFLSLC